MTTQTPIGFASGCFTAHDYDMALHKTVQSGGSAFEVGCYRTEWLALAHRWTSERPVDVDVVRSLHTPRFSSRAERKVANILGGLGLPLVLHADRLIDAGVWRDLGSSVLVENLAEPETFGSDLATLDTVFDALPDAGFCLDVSHAFAAGGMPLLRRLAHTYRTRLAQLHVGCTGVSDHPGEQTPDDTHLVEAALSTAGRTVPVIVERPLHNATQSDLMATIDALSAVCAQFGGDRP